MSSVMIMGGMSSNHLYHFGGIGSWPSTISVKPPSCSLQQKNFLVNWSKKKKRERERKIITCNRIPNLLQGMVIRVYISFAHSLSSRWIYNDCCNRYSLQDSTLSRKMTKVRAIGLEWWLFFFIVSLKLIQN